MAKPQQFKASTASLSSPTGGWNARDSIANMPPLDAVVLDNMYATPTDVQLRLGYKKLTDGINGRVNTLLNYASSTTQKLFAVAGTQIYRTDTQPATAVKTVLNDKWQYTNISNAGGHFLTAVNGVDQPLLYDGTDWINIAGTNTAQAIIALTHVDLVATATTAQPHGLFTGNKITIANAFPVEYNGTYVITKITNTRFSYTMATAPASNSTNTGVFPITSITYQGTRPLASITHVTNVATATAVQPHNLTTGMSVVISGASPTEYNGTWTVTVISPTAFTFTRTADFTADATTAGTFTTSIVAISTATTPAPHTLVTGNVVTISGCVPPEYNGTWTVLVTSPTTFQFITNATPNSDATTLGTYLVSGATYSVNYAITGVDPADLINVNLFKNRLYYTEKNSMKVWYLDVDAIAGAAQPLDFGGIAASGGFIQAMGTWTIDAGQGVNDYAVFATNMGEIIVYEGDDPANVDTWALRGVWQLGYIFERRCFFKWSGDLLLLSQDGLTPLASALQSSRLDPRINLTDKIYYAISQAASLYSTFYGWQIHYYASENMLIINVPSSTGYNQFVMHTISKAWSSFSGIEASCWELSNDKMYFGGDGFVGDFWSAYNDDGSNINATIQQAYTYFENPGELKRFTMVRPIFQTDNGIPSVLAGINTDFSVQNNLGAISFNPTDNRIGTWDNAVWDQSTWGGGYQVTKNWQGVTGLGFSGGLAMKIASQGIDVHWVSCDYVFEKGGIL